MIDTSSPAPINIDHDTALTLLAELRVSEQPGPFNALDRFLFQNNIRLSGVLILNKAKEIARQRGVTLRRWKGEFKSDLAHALPSIGYLN